MSACPTADRLRQFLGDELSGPEESALARHVEQCPSCQKHLEALTQTVVRAGRGDTSPELHEAPGSAAWERALKWARRRPALAGLLLISAVALVAVAIVWQRAERQQAAALDQLEHSINLTNGKLFLLTRLQRADATEMAYVSGQETKAAVVFLEKVLAENRPSGERVRRLLGQAHYGLGLSHFLAGDHARAEDHYENAKSDQAALVAEFPGRLMHRVDLALTFHGLGQAREALGRKEDAASAYARALTLFAELPADDTRLALLSMHVAQALFDRDKLPEAIPWQNQAVAQLEAAEDALKSSEARVAVRARRKVVLCTRALSLMQLGRLGEALADWDRVLELEKTQAAVRWRLFRARTLAMAGDHAAAASEMNELTAKGALEGAALIEGGLGGVLAELATVVYNHCRLAALVDQRLASAERERLAEEYTVRFVALLAKARDAGLFKDAKYRTQVQKESALDFLRERADFRAFLKSLGD